MTDPLFLDLCDGRRIAYRLADGKGPLLVFLPGYLSDMEGSKATALFDWASRNGRACLLLDYSGCGSSSGEFAEGTLSGWRDEVVALVGHVGGSEGDDRAVLVGSSMGGWLMLLAARALGDRCAGLVGIAAAPDFTDWGYDADQKRKLADGETIHEDNDYGYPPTPTHPGFWADGQANRQLEETIPLTCPVVLLHGQRDNEVPWEVSLRLADKLGSDDVQVLLVKDADHRMSRDIDVARLLDTIASFLDRLKDHA